MEEGVRNAANDDEVCDPDSDEYGWTNGNLLYHDLSEVIYL